MKFDVAVTSNVASVIVSDNGRYACLIDAVKATLRAARDIEITVLVCEGRTCNLLDSFTGGLRRDSSIIKELLGVTVQDASLANRIKQWLYELCATYFADQKHTNSTEAPQAVNEQFWVGRTLSLDTRNHFHPIRSGVNIGGKK